jgi:DNA-binding NarL/FixJ family response regulator
MGEGWRVPEPLSRRTRVLLGNLEPMVVLGMDRVLTQDGMDVVVGHEPVDLVMEVRRWKPDAVVLGLDRLSSRELSEQVRTASPETKVILWARDEEVMEVLDPGAVAPRLISTSVPEELRSELSSCQANRVED